MFKSFLFIFFTMLLYSSTDASDKQGCISCHNGIEDIRHQNSEMMIQIKAMGEAFGDPEGCVVCHGGNPKADNVKDAHKGAPIGMSLDEFVRDPGSIWIAEKTCGTCHADTVANIKKSLMQTEAGKIEGNLYTWGHTSQDSTKVRFGNYKTKDEDGQVPNIGTDAYKAYMKTLIEAHPYQFPTSLEALPEAIKGPQDLQGKTKREIIDMAAITYQRSDCQRCHIGVRGRKGRGDWRGMGCSSCHIPYGNEGLYAGDDPTIDKKEKGKLLVHTMQSTREAKVKVKDMEYSGIHPETCNSCHNRGKRIGVSYVGLMEQPYGSPFTKGGKKQTKTHGKKYLHIKSDLHYEAGMTCQDCHTSIDMHGDGNIAGTTLAQVEIECADCHGTNTKYPWELPLGYGEEFGRKLDPKQRGINTELPYFMTLGTVYDKKDGYLLSARGNPLGNVVREKDAKGDYKVIAHLASGKDLEVPVLKTITKNKGFKTADAEVAMNEVQKHMDTMECYACHSDWAPQCYGCHVKVDYSKGKKKIDWLANGSTRLPGGETLESKMKNGKSVNKVKTLYGKASENRSYLRWENPVLGNNGEGRVSPIVPGCQVTFTIIGPDGETLALNEQALVNSTSSTQKVAGTDMAPLNPHTTGRKARSCASCHSDPKALGYGISNGVFLNKQGKDLTIDLEDLKTKKLIPPTTTVQIAGIKGANPQTGMDYDWSQVVTRDGKELQSVGTHWKLSGPLNQEQRENMERTGICMSCHQHMKNPKIWNKIKSDTKITDSLHTSIISNIMKEKANSKNPKARP